MHSLILITVIFILTVPVEAKKLHTKLGVNCGNTESVYKSGRNEIDYLIDIPYDPEKGYGFVNYVDPPPEYFLQHWAFGGDDLLYELYYYDRFGFSEYKFDVENGNYAVCIHLMESEHFLDDKRIMSFTIENKPVLRNYDIYEDVNRAFAVVHRFLVQVEDEQLNIEVETLKGESIISAISLIKLDHDDGKPTQPLDFEVIGSFEENIIRWTNNFEHDLAGYNLYKSKDGVEFEKINDKLLMKNLIVDKDVEVGKEYFYRATCVDHFGHESNATGIRSGVTLHKYDTELPVIEIEISEQNYNIMRNDIYSDEYQPARIKFKGKWDDSSRIRPKGAFTRPFHKSNYRIKFSEEIDGIDDLNLTSLILNDALILEEMVYVLRRKLNTVVQNTEFFHVKLNGEYIGLYMNREEEDDNFFKSRNIGDVNIYYAYNGDFDSTDREYIKYQYRKENNQTSLHSDLHYIVDFVHSSDDSTFKEEFPKLFDVGDFLRSRAAINYAIDVDQHGHNIFVYRKYRTSKWSNLNYDHNFSFYYFDKPIDLYTLESMNFYNYNFLFDKLMDHTEFRYYFIKQFKKIPYEIYTDNNVENIIDSIYSRIKKDAYRDIYKYAWGRNDQFDNGVNRLKNVMKKRNKYIDTTIAEYEIHDFNEYNRLYINEIYPHDKGWIELYNDNVIPVDLYGVKFIYTDTGEEWSFAREYELDAKTYLRIDLGINGLIPLNPDPQLGELKLLIKGNGEKIHSLSYSNIPQGYSCGLEKIGGNCTFFEHPTPGERNVKPETPTLIINEIMPMNDTTIHNNAGESNDWFELYNVGDETINLYGLYLSDDKEEPFKWAINDSLYIKPKEHILLWADKEPIKGPNHVYFKLDQEGESLGLYTHLGEVIDTITFPELNTDESYGRKGDGSDEWVVFNSATPNETNNLNSIIIDPKLDYDIYPSIVYKGNNLSFTISKINPVSIDIYDQLGRKIIQVCSNSKLFSGEHKVNIGDKIFARGSYYISFRTNEEFIVKSFIVL